MAFTWVALAVLYCVVPIHFDYAPTLSTWAIMSGLTVLFSASSVVGHYLARRPSTAATTPARLDFVIIACAVAGICGALAIATDKIFLSGMDWSKGISVVRDQRALQVVEGTQISRSILLYTGYLLVSFSTVATSLFLLEGERIGRLAGWLGQASVLAMVIYGLVYGGRMPLLLVVLLAFGAVITRKIQGRTLLPKGWYLLPKLALIVAILVVYTNFIFADRREMNEIGTFNRFLEVVSEKWEMQPSEWAVDLVESGIVAPGAMMDALSSAMYLTHSPTTVQRILDHVGSISAFGGLYQIGILSPMADLFLPSLELPAKMRSQLADSGIYGWFPSAWGALIIDLGAWGSPVGVIVWGILAGLAYGLVRGGAGPGAQLMLTFAYMTVLVSPLNGPFGMANSFLIFTSFVTVGLYFAIKRYLDRGMPHVRNGRTV